MFYIHNRPLIGIYIFALSLYITDLLVVGWRGGLSSIFFYYDQGVWHLPVDFLTKWILQFLLFGKLSRNFYLLCTPQLRDMELLLALILRHLMEEASVPILKLLFIVGRSKGLFTFGVLLRYCMPYGNIIDWHSCLYVVLCFQSMLPIYLLHYWTDYTLTQTYRATASWGVYLIDRNIYLGGF